MRRYCLTLDSDTRLPVAIVNAAFAQKYFGRESALGRRFRTVANNGRLFGPWRTIVGVVQTTRMLGPFNNPNVDETGFFCYMSKRKSEGYLRKLAWTKARFDEGMRIRMLRLPERGFIEYIPGEMAWRAVHAPGHMIIHCLWVIGSNQGSFFEQLSHNLKGRCKTDIITIRFGGQT